LNKTYLGLKNYVAETAEVHGLLQLTASPSIAEASTRERWQFGALTNRKTNSSNRDPSLTSLYYY